MAGSRTWITSLCIDVFDGGGIGMTKRGQIITKISAIGGNHD